MSDSSRPAPARRLRCSPLIAAIACVFPAAAWAQPAPVPTDITVSTVPEFITALGQVAGPTCDPNGYRITATSPFTVSASTPLPTIGCANVEIAGGANVTIVDASYGGLACGLNAAPVAGLTKVSGVLVQGFDATTTSAGMCGKLDASGNTVTGNSIGFSLAGGANIVGNTISANLVKGVSDSGTGSTVAQNVISGNSGYGIYAASGMVIDANTITNNTSAGIYGLDAMVITGNTITGNGWEGVKVFDAATITGNLIANNGSGIDAGAGAVIKGNTVRDHMAEGTGIDLYDGGTIGGTGAGEGNVVYNNYVDIYAYTGTTYGGPLEIVNNLVGTPDGAAPGTSYYGINVYYQAAAYNIAGNVISSHTSGPGLRIRYATAAGTVSGNMIGVNASGTAALPNQGAGIELANLSAGVTVDNNVSSGNAGSGVNIYQVPGVTLSNNRIGTNAAGTSGIGNGAAGLVVSCAGPLSVSGNVISANAQYGGYLSGVMGSTFTGNFIGTAADGMSPLANAGPGISLNSTACGPSLRDPGLEPKAVKVAVENVFDGNVVAHNNGDGFYIWGGVGNVVRGGSIHSNGGKNINLDFADGPLPNDALDADTGPNMRQNHPVVASVIQGGTDTVVQYTLASTPDGTFSIDFYANGAGGVPAGQTFLGRVPSVTTDGAGNAAGSITFAGAHEYVTATATGLDGTSEFSLPVAALAASIAPTTLNFGNVIVGGASAPQTVTITSTGHAPYVISSMVTASTPPACPGSGGVSICASGDFTCSTNCLPATPYGLGASCTITAAFQPMVVGAGNTTLYICDNTSPTARAVPFSGNGIAMTLGASPASYDFGPVPLGSRALSPPIVISNPTAAPASIFAIAAGAPFAVETSSCGTTLPAGSSCEVTVAYSPTAMTTQAGALTLTLGYYGNPLVVPLQGTGAVAYAISPAQHDFGTQPLDTPSTPFAFTLSNSSASNVPLGTPGATTPFSVVSTTCAGSIPANGYCTVSAAFTPSANGPVSGELMVPVAVPGGPPMIALLTGTGGESGLGRLSLPSIIDFGAPMLASNPLRQSLQLQNTGGQDVMLVLITATPPFTVAHDCPARLAPGAACMVDVTFAPLYYGLSLGRLTVASNAEGGEKTATLVAAVSSVPYSVTPAEASFGPQLVGQRSPTRAFVIANNGDNAIALTEVAVSGPFTLVTNTCETSLAPRSSCRAEVAFEPARAGPATGSLSALVGLAGAPAATALLTGSGIQQPVIVLPATIDFGSVVLGSAPSVARELELRNTGNAVLTFTASASGPFALSGTCGSTLAPGAACNLVLTFAPAAAGEFTGSLAIVSNAPGGSRSIGLIVRVTREMAPFIGLAPTFIGYGERIIGTLSAAQRVTVTNYGGSDAVLGAITAGADFVVHSQCGPVLAPQASCAVDVAMRPLRFGPRPSQLLVPSNAAGSPNAVELLGTGCRPFTMFSSRSGLRSSCSP